MRTLGLDIGTNSIGWALIEQDQKIVDCGVRIFPIGVKEDDYNKSGSEVSKNAARRIARTVRRGYFRYKIRRRILTQLLSGLNLLPDNELMNLTSRSLYQLRKKALDEQISLKELGRIFLLLNQRRGFKSSRKDNPTAEGAKERSEMKLAMQQLELHMQQNNCRTVGEFFYSLFERNEKNDKSFNKNQPTENIRSRFVNRKLYSQEFDLIWDTQKTFHPDVLTDENKKRIKDDCLYYQRKLRSQKHLVGKCRFEPTKKCTPMSSIEFQEFRLWQVINNLRVTNAERFRSPLNMDEKTTLFNELNRNESITHAQIKKLLKLPASSQFNDLPEKLKGNTTHARIAKAIGDTYWSLSHQEKKQLWHTLFFATDEDWLTNYSVEKFGLTDVQANKYASVFLEEGYSNVSLKALLLGKQRDIFDNGILFHLKNGLGYAEAALAAGYHHSYSEIDSTDRLLSDKITIQREEQIKNPLVQQCVSESARLVNALIKKHGRPDVIKVEMARSLKKPKSEREKIKRRNDEKQRKRDEYREFLCKKFAKVHIGKTELIKFELFLEMAYAEDDLRKLQKEIDIDEFRKLAKNIKADDKEKYALWLECGRISPYSGKVISLSQLFSSEIDIEHIIPYSKCMDDSFANKTLCERAVNEEKGNRTPYEYLGGDSKKWAEFKERIKTFGDSKQAQFTRHELPDDFLNSQLNNTAYVAREVVRHFKKVCYDVKVTNGQATSRLRKFWGLNDLLNTDGANEKSRHDHRHHIVDAIVIAFTTPRYIQLLSHESQFDGSGKMTVKGIKFPYPSFKLEVNERIQEVFVSYRNKKRLLNSKVNKYIQSTATIKTPQKTYQVRGPLHEETNYGRILNPYNGEYNYVSKKPIIAIETDKQIDKIVDKKIKEIVRDHIRAYGGKIKQALSQPVYMKTKDDKLVPIRTVRMIDNAENLILLRPKENAKLFVSSGNNYAVAIYENESGVRDFETISFYDAVKRKKAGESLIPLYKENKPLLCHLKQKDMVLLYKEHPDEIDWNNKRDLFARLCKVVKFDVAGQLFFSRHNIAKYDKKTERNVNFFQQKYTTLKVIKVRIDMLGNLVKDKLP